MSNSFTGSFFSALTEPQSIVVVIGTLIITILSLTLYTMFKAVQSLSLAMENRPPEIVTVAPQLECYTLRTVNIPGIGTFGTITGIFGEFICRTVEREWMNNRQSISCIPAGYYDLIYTESARFGMRFHLENENVGVTVNSGSQRTHCLIHASNEPLEVEGCIAPGLKYMDERWGVYPSGDALKLLEADLLKTNVHKLEIIRS